MLVPWTVRTQLRLGALVVVATSGAASLWVGHPPDATGGPSAMFSADWLERFGHLQRLPPLDAEVALALDQMRRRPDRVVALVPAKVAHLFAHDRGALAWMEVELRRLLHPSTRRWLDRAIDGWFFAVLALAVAGVRHLRRGPAAIVPLVVAWLTLAHAVLFFGSPRFHHALLPALSLLAAAEVVAWAQAVRPARTA